MSGQYKIWLLTLIFVFLLITTSAYAQKIQISEPLNGATVNVGQTISIKVHSEPSVEILYVAGSGGLSFASRGESPHEFTLTIPANKTPGRYTLSAVGNDHGNPVFSEPVFIEVHTSDMPSGIEMSESMIQFEKVGDELPVDVHGSFPNGRRVRLTNSSETKFKIENESIASVSTDGVVTAKQSGSTTLTASYKGLSAKARLQIPLGKATPVYKVITAPDISVTKDSLNRYFIDIHIVNNSNGPLSNLIITKAVLNNTAADLIAPNQIKTAIEAGDAQKIGFVFPAEAGGSKTSATLHIEGSYVGLLWDWSTTEPKPLNFTLKATLP